jgi:serine/threonine-protein kinase
MGIVHRDIKPANVHLDQNGRVRLMDFGIARSKSFELTQTGVFVGTPSYMAPEQVQALYVDYRADLYSFGVLAFELVSGRCPVQGETLQTVFYRILHETLPLKELRTVGAPDALVRLIAQCTEKQAENRPESATEICRQLDAMLQEDKALSPAIPLPEIRPQSFRHRRMGAAVAAGGLALALIFLATITLYRQKQAPAPILPTQPDHGKAGNDSMNYIPTGPLTIRERGKKPHTAFISAFFIDQHPVTWGQLRRFCDLSHLPCPPEAGNSPNREPAVLMNFDLAQAYARAQGKRLPSMMELERFHPHRVLERREPLLGEPEYRVPSHVTPFQDGGPPEEGPFRGAAFLRLSYTSRQPEEKWEFTANPARPTKRAVLAYVEFLQPPPTTEEPWVYLHGDGQIRSPFTQGVADGWTICPTRYRAVDIGFRCARDAK